MLELDERVAGAVSESSPLVRAAAGRPRGRRAPPAQPRHDEQTEERDASLREEHDTAVVASYIGLGSNLGDREATLRAALARLNATLGIRVVAVSSFRETDPVGPVADQPRFVNAVAEVATELEPRPLLDTLLAVERALGRARCAERWGPRTIDLDLLLYGDRIIDEPGLRIPHPRLHERLFVLEPLAELAPHLHVPGRGRLETLRRKLE